MKEQYLQLDGQREVGRLAVELALALLFKESKEAPFDPVPPHPCSGDDAAEGPGALTSDAGEVPAMDVLDGDGPAMVDIVLEDEAEGVAAVQVAWSDYGRSLVAAGEDDDAADGRHGDV